MKHRKLYQWDRIGNLGVGRCIEHITVLMIHGEITDHPVHEEHDEDEGEDKG